MLEPSPWPSPTPTPSPSPSPSPTSTPVVTPTPDPLCGYYRNVCMATQPKYCNVYGQIIDYCSACGCPGSLFCTSDETCSAHTSWYEFWNGINWWNWSWILLAGAIFMFFIGVAMALKRWTN
jgi:hypothetical protein